MFLSFWTHWVDQCFAAYGVSELLWVNLDYVK